MSCNDAEFMLNNTIGFSGSKITEISGRYLISTDNVYADINPASREWYDCWVSGLSFFLSLALTRICHRSSRSLTLVAASSPKMTRNTRRPSKMLSRASWSPLSRFP